MPDDAGSLAGGNAADMVDASSLFRSFACEGLSLPNRIVMAPMTRFFAKDGIPSPAAAAYYRRRAEGGAGLIVTEATYIPHWAASYDSRAPDFHGDAAMAAWQGIASEVHAAGGKIIPQLWHVGLVEKADIEGLSEKGAEVSGVGPSGLMADGRRITEPMTEQDIAAVIDAFARAAKSAKAHGFDGIEIHAAHGYLIDQFFWEQTNRRGDDWGGDVAGRTRFAAEIIKACRTAVGPAFPIILRISQWKQQDFAARLACNPAELEDFLTPLVDAGTSLFHCSQRRFWQPEFHGSTLNLAGWTKKITNLPVITVGSVGLDTDFIDAMFNKKPSESMRIDQLTDRLEAGEFDLVAIGRSMLSNPDWANLVRDGRYAELRGYDMQSLTELH